MARAENDHEVDREAQRSNEIFTGIRMVFMQDQAVTKSMEPITDHFFEHLVMSGQMAARIAAACCAPRSRCANRARRRRASPMPG